MAESRLWQSLVAAFLEDAQAELAQAYAAPFVRGSKLPDGKRLRSSVFLLSHLCVTDGRGADDGRRSKLGRLSAAIELLHEASLIHDDLVDGSAMRRGQPSAYAANGSGLALLVGDYLVFRGLKLVLDAADSISDVRLAQELASTGLAIAEGEASQLHRYLHPTTYPDQMSVKSYLEIIGNKTASFFGACCEAGAALGGAPPNLRSTYRRFGMAVGLAFQIVDDTIDVAGDETVALKTLRRNLAEGTITLPVILAYRLDRRAPAFKALARNRALTRSEQAEIYSMARSASVLEQCGEMITFHLDIAGQCLVQMPPNVFRLGLADMVDYVASASWGLPHLNRNKQKMNGRRRHGERV